MVSLHVDSHACASHTWGRDDTWMHYVLLGPVIKDQVPHDVEVQKWFRNGVRNTATIQGVHLASKFSRSQSSRASLRCDGQTGQVYGGSTTPLTGPKGSAANVLASQTTAHLQRSYCASEKGGPSQYCGRSVFCCIKGTIYCL